MAGRVPKLEDKLKALPAKPGVYLFRDARGEVLYIGKAKSLRPRVRSYFQASADTRTAMAQLPERVADLEVIVTDTEVEALHLEQNLVKRHRPPFNVRLRDDKSFPYIAVTVEDDYPRVMFTRERHRRGVVYFGPYANAKKVRETLDVLNRVFQFRPCEGPKPGRHSGTPCLDVHIERGRELTAIVEQVDVQEQKRPAHVEVPGNLCLLLAAIVHRRRLDGNQIHLLALELWPQAPALHVHEEPIRDADLHRPH
jgi:excinuclease UvrABC nuclease subunit